MSKLLIEEQYNSPGRSPVGLAWNGRYIWNTDNATSKIYRIDPEDGEHDIELVCPGNLSGLGWDGTNLWQSLHDGGTLRRINPETNDFDQTIMVWEHGWLSGVTWDGQYLWANSQQHGKLFKIDPNSGETISSLKVPLVGGGLTYKDGSLWLSIAYPMTFNESGNHFEWAGDKQQFAILEIDAATGSEKQRVETDFLAMGLTWVGDELWMAHSSAKKLYRTKIIGHAD